MDNRAHPRRLPLRDQSITTLSLSKRVTTVCGTTIPIHRGESALLAAFKKHERRRAFRSLRVTHQAENNASCRCTGCRVVVLAPPRLRVGNASGDGPPPSHSEVNMSRGGVENPPLFNVSRHSHGLTALSCAKKIALILVRKSALIQIFLPSGSRLTTVRHCA